MQRADREIIRAGQSFVLAIAVALVTAVAFVIAVVIGLFDVAGNYRSHLGRVPLLDFVALMAWIQAAMGAALAIALFFGARHVRLFWAGWMAALVIVAGALTVVFGPKLLLAWFGLPPLVAALIIGWCVDRTRRSDAV
jgi:hypothetical protein